MIPILRLPPGPRRRRPARRAGARRQRGAVLLVALLLLALMLALGSGALETALVEQRVSSNLRDRGAAFETSEATALAAHGRVRWLIANGRGQPDNTAGWYEAGTLPASGGGLAAVDNAGLKFWSSFSMGADNSLSSGLTAAAPGQPAGRFLIERLEADDETEPASASTYQITYNRVTVWAPGNGGANVMVQTVFVGLPE